MISQIDVSANASQLKEVSATSLFLSGSIDISLIRRVGKARKCNSLQDPFHQPALLLRLIGLGYGFLPTLTLAHGTYSTISQAPFGDAKYRYNSTVLRAGQDLHFLASKQPTRDIALYQGYLLTVDGDKEG